MSMKKLLMRSDVVAVLRDMDERNVLVDLEPSLAELRMPVRKGYNHKDNLTHSIQVLENAIAREVAGPDLILRTAALFHDIGKPATRKFGARGSVTFEGHEHVGARMMNKILSAHGYSKAEKNEIFKLVAFHMRSHGFTSEMWTDSAVRRLATEVGSPVTLDRLVILFYADVTTKFPAKKANLHASVDALVDALNEVARKDARKALRPAVDGNFVMSEYGLAPGAELGRVMRFLNSDEGVHLSKDEVLNVLSEKFGLSK